MMAQPASLKAVSDAGSLPACRIPKAARAATEAADRFGPPSGRAYIAAMPLDLADPAVKTDAAPRPARLAPLLLVGAGLAFVAAGSLLWWRHGAAVFTDFAVAALAWCF